MNIPDEAVEAAERGLRECLESQGIKLVTEWKDEARAALVAAMPHVRRQIAEEVRGIQVWKEPNTTDPLPADYTLMGQLEMRDRAAYQIEGDNQ